MTTMSMAIPMAAICLAAATPASQQPPLTKAVSVTATATIQSIDTPSRTVTLRDDKGQLDTYVVGPEVQRFNEFKVGDTVKATYYEAVVLQVRKPGEQAGTAGATTDVAAGRAASGAPAAALAVQDRMTVTVKAIDPAVPSLTVATPDGLTVTRKVGNKKNIEGVKVGDVIDVTYTRALLTSVEPAK